MDVHLPDSLHDVNEYAFGGTSNSRVDVTLHMSGKLAQYFDEHSACYSGSIIRAHGFIIDGKRYDGIKEYVKKTREQEQLQREAEEREQQARARREREAAERQAIEARKAAERERINEEIHGIFEKMDSLHGLFAGISEYSAPD